MSVPVSEFCCAHTVFLYILLMKMDMIGLENQKQQAVTWVIFCIIYLCCPVYILVS